MPTALSWCEGEVDITHEWITSESGQIIGVDRLIRKHGADRIEETQWRTSVVRTGSASRLPNSSSAIEAEQLIRLDAQRDLETLTETTRQHNERALQVNRRVCVMVHELDDSIDMDASAADLKRWWYDFNGFESSSQKLPVYRKLVEDRYVRRVGQETPPCECLVKGTLVWTDRGARPIETLKPGDQVLSCDVETAELSYQSVLERTVRPPTPLVTIELAEETITASPGHPFWVAGRGWVMARDLKETDPIHAADSIVVVKSLGTAPAEPTYNLRVEQNRNYFVGKSRVLSHDVQLRSVSTGPLPGISRQDLAMLAK